jgi:rfaE bifunctional protein kinase chain/domain
MTITLPRLAAILDEFPQRTIGLVGDLFLDRYLEVDSQSREVSLETGLEAYQIRRVRNAPGALGTVINNLAALGVGRLRPVTVIGDDGHGYDLRRELAKLSVEMTGVILDAERPTPTYTKPLRESAAGGWEELNRLDIRPRGPLRRETSRRVIETLRDVFSTSDGVIVLDQVPEPDWGVINTEVREALRDLAEEEPSKLLFIDSRAHLGKFTFGVAKGNRSELVAAVGHSAQGDNEASAAAAVLVQRTRRPVFCTLGERGILVASPGQSPVLIPGCPVAGPTDIVGAGDAATSGIVTALLSGANEMEAAAVGNLVASITVQQLGTTGTARPNQVLARWQEVYGM